MSSNKEPLVTCTACGREVTGISGHNPVADSRGVFHAADCPSLKDEKAPSPASEGEVDPHALKMALGILRAIDSGTLDQRSMAADAMYVWAAVENRGGVSWLRKEDPHAQEPEASLPAARGVVSEEALRFVLECINGRIDLTKNSLFAWSKSDRPEAKERIAGIEREVAKQESMRTALSAALSQGGGGEGKPTAGPNLVGFCEDVLKEWPEGGVDGFQLQEIAEKHGLLIPEQRHAFCTPDDDESGACSCREYCSDAELKTGFTCYRRVKLPKPPAQADGV